MTARVARKALPPRVKRFEPLGHGKAAVAVSLRLLPKRIAVRALALGAQPSFPCLFLADRRYLRKLAVGKAAHRRRQRDVQREVVVTRIDAARYLDERLRLAKVGQPRLFADVARYAALAQKLRQRIGERARRRAHEHRYIGQALAPVGVFGIGVEPPYPVDKAYHLRRDELRLRVRRVRRRRAYHRVHAVRALRPADVLVDDVILGVPAAVAARVNQLIRGVILAAEVLGHQPRKDPVHKVDDGARRAMIVVEPQMRIARRFALALKALGRTPPKTVYRLLDVADEKHLRAERRKAVRYRILQRVDVLILVYKHVPHRRGYLRAAAVVGEHAPRSVLEIGIIDLAERGFFRVEQLERRPRGAAQRGGIRRAVYLARARILVKPVSRFFAIFFKPFERVVDLRPRRRVAPRVLFRGIPRRGKRVDPAVEEVRRFARRERHRVKPDRFSTRGYIRTATQKLGAPLRRHAVELGEKVSVGYIRGEISVGILGGKRMIDYALYRFDGALAAPRRQHAEHDGQFRVVRELFYRGFDARGLYQLDLGFVRERRGGIEPRGVIVRPHEPLAIRMQRADIAYGHRRERILRLCRKSRALVRRSRRKKLLALAP